MNPVLTKTDFYRRFYAGEFGNHGPMWETLNEWDLSGYEKEIAIRVKTRGGRCDYLIPREEVYDRYNSFLKDGYSPDQLNFSAQCPEEDKIISGEIQLSSRGLEFFGSYSLLPMRQALSEYGFTCHGLEAHCHIEAAMCPNSWNWLNHLLENYPDHVIEFTTLRYSWGVLPHYNTVIWEVRKY